MATGFPQPTNFANGDVLQAASVNDITGTINLLAPSAKGDLFAGSAANTYTKLSVGTNGQVLTADSSTATGLKWSAAAAGGWSEISSTSLSGSSVAISSIPGTYKHLRLALRDWSTSADAAIYLRVNGITTSTYSQLFQFYNGAASGNANNYCYVNVDKVSLTDTTSEGDTGYHNHAIIDFPDYSASNSYILGNFWTIYRDSSGQESLIQSMFAQESAAVVSSITIYLSTGTFDEGTAVLYGL